MSTDYYGNAPICVVCGEACDCGEHHAVHRGETSCGACSICWESHDEDCHDVWCDVLGSRCQLCEINKTEVA